MTKDRHKATITGTLNKQRSKITKQPLVSVILPTYNRREMLPDAIKSILSQTLQDFEILIVNDAGEDVSDIINSFNDDRILHFKHIVNKGSSSARNTAIVNAKGKYIAYLDDDDKYYEKHLKILSEYLEEHPKIGLAYTDAVYSIQEKFGDKYVEIDKYVKYSLDYCKECLLNSNFIPVNCIMHRKDCLHKTGLFDTTLYRCEDWDLLLRFSRHFQFAHIRSETCQVR